jgi:hypothetical protein
MKCALYGQLYMNISPGSGMVCEPCSGMTLPHLCESLNLPNPTDETLVIGGLLTAHVPYL